MSRHNDISGPQKPTEISVVNETTGKKTQAHVLNYSETAVTVALAEVKITLTRDSINRPYTCKFAGMDLLYQP